MSTGKVLANQMNTISEDLDTPCHQPPFTGFHQWLCGVAPVRRVFIEVCHTIDPNLLTPNSYATICKGNGK